MAWLTRGMGDALNARSFLINYCNQKCYPRESVFIYTDRHAVLFENDGFTIKPATTKPTRLYNYPVIGEFNFRKLYKNNIDRDECLAKNAGIRFDFNFVTPLNWTPEKIDLTLPNKFVTINYGYDNVAADDELCAKVWPVEYWEELVDKIGIPCVQIGAGKNCKIIKGTALNLVDKLSIKQSAEVMKKAMFHLDTEGGLVILNHHLGNRSAVLFGPTSVRTYGLNNNLNIRNTNCPDSPCDPRTKPLNHGIYMKKTDIRCSLSCMTDLKPAYVIEQIKQAGWL